MPKLSACLITKDEATNLARCLRSVRRVADEIVVVDTGSTDDTVEVARTHGAQVAIIPWQGDFALARNAALGLATGDWVLVIDADEELDDASVPSLRAAIGEAGAEAYWVRIVSYLGDTPDEGLTVENLYPRLFRRRPRYRFAGRIHEQVLPALIAGGGEVRSSEVALLHYGYLNPAVTQKGKIARNTAMIEQALKTAPADPYHWFNLGTEHLRDRRPADAETAFRRALSALGTAEPRYLSVVVRNLTLALRDQGKSHEALRVLRTYQSHFPDYTDLVYFEGLVRSDLFDWDGVEAAMLRALAMGDAPADRYLVLRGAGTTLPLVWIAIAKMERGEEALPALQTAVDALPHDPQALERLVQRSCSSEGIDAALARVRPVAATGRLAARRVARALAKAGAYKAAIEILSPDDADDPLVMLFRGECLFRLGRLEDAMWVFGSIPRNDPAALPAALNRVQTALVAGDIERARAAFAEAQSLNPHGVDAILRTLDAIIAVVEESAHPVEIPETDRPLAIPLIRNVMRSALAHEATGLVARLSLLLRLAGLTDGAALCLIGKLAYLERRYSLAGQYLARAFAMRGLDAEGCAIAAGLHRMAQNYRDALALYQAFLKTGTRGALGVYIEAAEVALKLRRLDEAVACLDAGLVAYPSSTLLGRARAAIATVRGKAREVEPSDQVLAQA